MNYLFYDYETSGRSEKFDQIFQFAAIRTDEGFNQLGEPINLFCKLRPDILPSPYAIRVNQIDLSELDSEGLNEFEFAKRVYAALTGDGDQCIVGYNSKNFDNNFTRFLFYRNFLDPYSWGYFSGNSCLDILDIFRLGYSFDRLRDFKVNDGVCSDSLKLEDLAKWNGLFHFESHNALYDVMATIQLAKLLRDRCPRLFEHAGRLRSVSNVRKIIAPGRTFFHSCNYNGYERRFLSVHSLLCEHPIFRNSAIGWNLRYDPRAILSFSAQEIRDQMYSKKNERLFDVGFEEFKLNKTPMVVSFTETEKARVVDHEACAKNLTRIQETSHLLIAMAKEIFSTSIPEVDPDADLYAGDYFWETRYDAELCRAVRDDPMAVNENGFKSVRLRRLFRRLRARNFYRRLDNDEQAQYDRFCATKFAVTGNGMWMTKSMFEKEYDEVMVDTTLSEKQKHCLSVLRRYVDDKETSRFSGSAEDYSNIC